MCNKTELCLKYLFPYSDAYVIIIWEACLAEFAIINNEYEM